MNKRNFSFYKNKEKIYGPEGFDMSSVKLICILHDAHITVRLDTEPTFPEDIKD